MTRIRRDIALGILAAVLLAGILGLSLAGPYVVLGGPR